MIEECREHLASLNPEMIVYDDLEEALLGACCRFGQDPIAIYDYEKCIEIRMRDGSSYEEAVEFHELNTMNLWAGKYTPAFLVLNCTMNEFKKFDLTAIRDRLNLSENASDKDIIAEIDYIENDAYARGMKAIAEILGAAVDDDPIEFAKAKMVKND